MPRHDETTFSVHGLDADARVVRANVFVQKLGQLITALRAADKIANGKHTHDYMLPRLLYGSAVATIRERPRRPRERPQSPISYFGTMTMAVYDGSRGNVSHVDQKIVEMIEKLSRGANKRFAHAELSFPDETVLRVDDYLQHRAEDLMQIHPRNAIVSLNHTGGPRSARLMACLRKLIRAVLCSVASWS